MKNNNISPLSSEDIASFEELAKMFAKKSVSRMFETESSDGNSAMLPEVLKTAFEIGIASSADRTRTGSEHGVWGSASDTSGPVPSGVMLSAISEMCAGVAMCIHSQGIASNIILSSKKEIKNPPIRAALCLQEDPCLPFCAAVFHPDKDAPARVSTVAEPVSGGYVITGSKKFVYCMQGVDACVVLARVAERWGCFIVPSGSEGLKKIDIGQRTGLRACDVHHIELAGVKVPESARIDDGDALPMVMKALSLNWLGMSAIAVGAARRAVSEAKKYSSERYQGGAMIETHPAVKMLIASSEAKALAAESTVNSFADFGSDPVKCLRQAAMTKLSVLELSNKAVTDSLQVFGGYGYMDDFGMSKRLRDVITLKSASGSPAFLKQFIFDLEKIDM